MASSRPPPNAKPLTAAITGASAFTQKDGMFIDKVTIVGEEGVLKVKATNHLQGIVYKNIPFVSADLTDTSFDAFSVTSKDILKESQSNFYKLIEGNVRVVMISLYPIESGFLKIRNLV